MKTCQVAVPLAILSTLYIIASGYYMIRTRTIGTPFNDALQSYPDLVLIKQNSAKQRYRIFYEGLVVGIILLVLYNFLR